MTRRDLMRHGGADTSVAAHAGTPEGQREIVRERVLAHVQGLAVGATCDEVERALGLSHQTASARITELLARGVLFDSGMRRPTVTGRTARVYKAVGA